MEENQRTKHESYGLLHFSRVNSNNEQIMFGSSVRPRTVIQMSVAPAIHERSISNDWFFTHGRNLIEVEMTELQFAQAITSMNMGSGIPVTIKEVNGKKMEECPWEDKRTMFENEFDRGMKRVGEHLGSMIERAKEILSDGKAPKKADKEEILNALYRVEQFFASNGAFIHKQFTEHMDHTVSTAKAEFDAYMNERLKTLGLDAVRDGIEKPELSAIENKEQNHAE